MIISSCSGSPWNDPYPQADRERGILYSAFSERPKHFDPGRSYSENEADFISNIYEPPLQYHYLKRPYELTIMTATEVPRPRYYDADGNELLENAPESQIARSVYRIAIKPGILYQPHPAFARNDAGEFLYHDLSANEMSDKFTLADFTETGTRELTAEDYVYQIKRLAYPAVHSPIAGLLGEHILGFAEFYSLLSEVYQPNGARNGDVDLRTFDLEGVSLIDRYTYEIILKDKYPQFIYWLAMNFFAPMPWEAIVFYSQPGMNERNITLDWYPVGTGPYMLTENNPNLRMVLEANPNYHGEVYPSEGSVGDEEAGYLEPAGQPLPFIYKAVFSLEKESIPYWNKFLQGYYDASGITSDSFDQAINFGSQGEAQLTADMQERGISLVTATETSIVYIGFNMLDDVVGGDSDRARKLRRAISIAVDYEEMLSIFANGRGVLAQGPLPPDIFGYRDGEDGLNPYVYVWTDGTATPRAIEDARQLMREAGYPDGIDAKTGNSLILYFDTPQAGPGTKAYFDWLRKQFKKLGIQLIIRSTDYNRFQEKMSKGTAQIFQWGWNADYPDPENFLFLLYGPNSKVLGHGENAANYKNEEYDRLFDSVKNMKNGAERQAVIDEMIEILRRDAPWLWGYYPVSFSLTHSWFKSAKPHLMANNTLKYKQIDPIQRAQLRSEWNQPVTGPVIVMLLVFACSVVPAVISVRRKQKETVSQ
jgi:oligopeptide transport system substrate-binding protein